MPIVHVFLDTSVLPRHPGYWGVGFERIGQLVDSGLAKIHLSTVVAKEWESQLAEDFADAVSKAKTPLEKLLRHPWVGEIQGQRTIRAASERLGRAPVNEIVSKKFKGLLKRLQADVLPIGANHGGTVIEDYFAGTPPFEKPKNRDDFPDAFIFQCAKDLAAELGAELHCVIADNNLRQKLSQVQNIRVYPSINDFVQSEVITNAVSQQRLEQIWKVVFARLSQQLPEQTGRMIAELETLTVDKLAFTYISHPSIPDDNNEAIITAVYEPVEVRFEWDNVRDFGPGLVTLPVIFECKAEIDFSVYRGDAYDVPAGVWVEHKDPEEHHYFDSGGLVELSVRCTMSLQFDIEGLSEESIPSLRKVDIDSIRTKDVKENYMGLIFLTDEPDELQYGD